MAAVRKNVLFLSLFISFFSRFALGADEPPLTVFDFAGQSNMVGKRSKVAELPEAYRGQQLNVLLFDGDRWVPYHAGLGQKAGFGPEVAAALAWIDCDEITVHPDKIHYDTPGIVDLGRKMATAMSILLKNESE